MSLKWESRGEDALEADAGVNTHYRIERIQYSYSWRALFINEHDSKVLIIASRSDCIVECEEHHSKPQFVEGLAAAEPTQPLPTISRRDYFAGLAMQGLLANNVCDVRQGLNIAVAAATFADLMITVLDKEGLDEGASC